MTRYDIPYVLAVIGWLISICMMIAMMALWPHWRGWSAVLFVIWPLIIVFAVVIGFISVGLFRALTS